MKNSKKTSESEKIVRLIFYTKTALNLAKKEARQAQKKYYVKGKNNQSLPEDAISHLDYYKGKVAQAEQFFHALKMILK